MLILQPVFERIKEIEDQKAQGAYELDVPKPLPNLVDPDIQAEKDVVYHRMENSSLLLVGYQNKMQ